MCGHRWAARWSPAGSEDTGTRLERLPVTQVGSGDTRGWRRRGVSQGHACSSRCVPGRRWPARPLRGPPSRLGSHPGGGARREATRTTGPLGTLPASTVGGGRGGQGRGRGRVRGLAGGRAGGGGAAAGPRCALPPSASPACARPLPSLAPAAAASLTSVGWLISNRSSRLAFQW